jgi:TatD DNase family protein
VSAGPFVDSHAHLSLPGAFDEDREQALERARQAGVGIVLDLATRPEEFDACVAFTACHDGVHAAVGVHPHEARHWSPAVAARIRSLASSVVAVGEIGLDYHYDLSPRSTQRAAMADQLELAAEIGLPVSVHSREAEEDTLRLLADADVRRTGGVMHCFTGSETMARTCLELGLHISFSGIVTFANADRLRGIARELPADRLLLETDSPYLAPVPHRGKRNEPARVVDVTRRVAELRRIDPEELARLATANFHRLFLSGRTQESPTEQGR